VTLRPPRDDEFDALLDLMNDHQEKVYGERDVSADELRTWLTAPSVVVERDLRVLEEDGRLLGYADVDSDNTDPPRWWCDVKIAPDADAAAVLDELLPWLDERAQAGTLRVWVGANDERIGDAFRARGFADARHSYRMHMSLDGDAREPRWPEGIEVGTLEPGEEHAVYEAVKEAWLDHSDPMTETFEEWKHWAIDRAIFDRSLWFLARDGAEIAGLSLCNRDEADENAGYVATLAVRRPWRRQGLGEALLLHSFAAFRARGWTRATLGVDASSPTGATRLYERAGMTVYRDTVFLERPVASG
jgi:ribosomal protein S18 acetylase RimI-like enzyme